MESETESKSNQPSGEPQEFNLVAWWSSIAGICLIVIISGTFLTRSYLKSHHQKLEDWRPGIIGRIENDLQAINRDGTEVTLSQLRGKVYIAGYQYTDCPGGCLGMASVMKELLDVYKNDPRFHLVSFSVNPEDDTPEKMDAWVKDKGVESEKWWFLTSDDPKGFRKYMSSEFKFYKPTENTDPDVIAARGKYTHDQRLFIVDEEAHIRGYYGVMHPEGGETAIKLLKRDLDMVLYPKKKLSDYPVIKMPHIEVKQNKPDSKKGKE